MDCPVNPAGADRCNRNGTATAILGGYTYGDLAAHQTTRRRTTAARCGPRRCGTSAQPLGREAALALITGRDAAVRPTTRRCSTRATRSSSRRSRCAALPAPPTTTYVEASGRSSRTRGMGFDATHRRTPDSTTADGGFALPRHVLTARAHGRSDPYPGGRQRRHDRARRARSRSPRRSHSAGIADLPGVTGTLARPTRPDDRRTRPPRGRCSARADGGQRRRRWSRGCPARCVHRTCPLTIERAARPTGPSPTTQRRVGAIVPGRASGALADRVAGGPPTRRPRRRSRPARDRHRRRRAHRRPAPLVGRRPQDPSWSTTASDRACCSTAPDDWARPATSSRRDLRLRLRDPGPRSGPRSVTGPCAQGRSWRAGPLRRPARRRGRGRCGSPTRAERQRRAAPRGARLGPQASRARARRSRRRRPTPRPA